MNIFFQSLYETLIFRFFTLAYPISLYFLYEKDKLFNLYYTIGLITLSLIYFICYVVEKKGKEDPSICAFYTKQILYILLGYLVQFHLAFFDTYEINDGELKINYILSVLKLLMIIETLKRIYFYIIGIIFFIGLECSARGDRSMYVMSFEIVYYYLWFNFYTNCHLKGFELPKCYLFIGIFFSILYGILALGCYFFVAKICFGVINLIYITAHAYCIFWRCREHY